MRSKTTRMADVTEIRQAITALESRTRAERAGELPSAQVAVLGRVLTQGPITPGELGRQLRMLPQSLTRPLASLERAGLLTRTPDPTDTRSALLEATAAGRAAIRAEFAPRTRWLARAMAEICDDADRDTLLRAAAIMQRIVDYGGQVAPREP